MTDSRQKRDNAAKRIARAVLPPVALTTYRRLRDRRRPAPVTEWEYLPGGWPESTHEGPGWNAESVVRTQLDRWPAFVKSVAAPAAFGLSNEARSGTRDYGVHNTILTFGYVLATAAAGHNRLSMLDWGGGIGHYCVYAHELMPALEIDYHCCDLRALAAAGRSVLPDATFHSDPDKALSRMYDLVMASSSLQYSREWKPLLRKLAMSTRRYLYVTRQPFVDNAPSFVVIQRPHRHGYETEYPGWFLNRGEFLAEAEAAELRLVREVMIMENPVVPGVPEQADYRGFLFERVGQ
jgi:putative methyltransferase (TIGR04325 family)